MKTVLTDNSLCAYTLCDDAPAEFIYKYIQSLAKAGVRYIELDFRTLMKLQKLPEGVGYIFRLVDPMFLGLADLYDFDYMLLTLSDVRRLVKTSVPVMLELPSSDDYPNRVFRYSSKLIGGQITAVRVRGYYPLTGIEETFAAVNKLKNVFPVPVDFCPTNELKTALDAAVKFTRAGIDSLTVTMGLTERYCSLEEYFFTLMSIFDALPGELSLSPLCAATVYHRYIFRNRRGDGITHYMDILDHDIHFLHNVDTNERVKLHMSLRDTEYLHRTFVTALEKMARDEDIPGELFDDLSSAIRHYDTDFFNSDLLNRKRRGLLN